MRFFQVQRITAVLLLVFMALHMVVVHYPPGTLDFTRVIERLGNPWWKVIDILFLATVLLHGVMGAYDVLMDYDGIARFRQIIAAVAIVLILVGFVYGTVTIINFRPELVAGL